MSVLPQAPRPEPSARKTPRSPELPASPSTGSRVQLEVHEVPLADPLVLWEAQPEAAAAYWRTPQGELFTGVGEALTLSASGEDRFEQVAAEARELLAGLELPFPGALRLIGGLAFDPEGGSSALWQGFGGARFVLPRFTYLPGPHDARLVVVRLAGESGEEAARITAEATLLRGALEENAPASPQGLWPARIERLPRETWSEWIDRVQAAIGSGVVSKVVLARESVLDLPVPLSGRAILSRLAAEHQDCFCFGLRTARTPEQPEQACFVGASPERLLRLDARRVQVDALAGTAGVPGRGASSSALERAAETLRTSLKDRSEHDYVVEAITEALTPLCPLLEVAEVPAVRQLRHVLHLHTPIEGLLSRPAHLLEVAAALHPTPAVAGTPTAEARAILGACEGRDRGWYAGPIGWFDAEGSGELCVGLRSGLLRGRQAHLFAGAGIVSGSRADAEYEETRLKERALCQALGGGAVTRPITMRPGAASASTHPLVPARAMVSSGASRGGPAAAPGYEQPLPAHESPEEPAASRAAPRPDGDLAREQAHTLLAALQAGGLRDLVVSSGSRSTPLTLAAAERAQMSDLLLHDIVDERSAAFFALGLARATGLAPALLCTSGSAAAHYHPAVLEAAHAGLPLLILSADRPPEARGRGAHQTIDQAALFRDCCLATEVLGLPDGHPDTLRGVAHLGARALHLTRAPRPGPVHLVAPFRKPLEPGGYAIATEALELPPAPRFFASRPAPDPEALAHLATRCQETERGLIVAGPENYPGSWAKGAAENYPGSGGKQLGDALWRLSEATGYPVVAEAGSQFRLDGVDRPSRIDAFPALLASGAAEELRPELILRLGAEPSPLGFAAWLGRQEAEVWLLAGGFAADGENRCAGVIEGELGQSLIALAEAVTPKTEPGPWLQRWQQAGGEAQGRLEHLLENGETLTEASVLRATLASLPGDGGGHLVLGNSLPLRMADLCGPGSLAKVPVHTQRGTSGIDGTVAGAAGVATATGEATTCVLGDLSLAHDLGSLGLLAGTPAPVTVVVPNNGGGRIFELLPAGKRPALRATVEQHLVMPGPASFESAAAHFGLAYHRVETAAELGAVLARAPRGSRLIEATVPPHAAREFMAALADGSTTP